MEKPGVKEEIFLVDKNAVSLKIQKEVNAQRVKGTVILMMVALVISCVEVTIVETITEMPHPMMTVVPQQAAIITMEVKLEVYLQDLVHLGPQEHMDSEEKLTRVVAKLFLMLEWISQNLIVKRTKNITLMDSETLI